MEIDGALKQPRCQRRHGQQAGEVSQAGFPAQCRLLLLLDNPFLPQCAARPQTLRGLRCTQYSQSSGTYWPRLQQILQTNLRLEGGLSRENWHKSEEETQASESTDCYCHSQRRAPS